MKTDTKALLAIVMTLEQRGDIVIRNQPTATKPGRFYRLVGAGGAENPTKDQTRVKDLSNQTKGGSIPLPTGVSALLAVRDTSSARTNVSPHGGSIMLVRSATVTLIGLAAAVIPYLLPSSFGATGLSEDVDCTQEVRFLPQPPPTLTVTLDSVAAFPNGRDPVWSPDGKWIAYRAKGALYAAPIDGSEPARLVGKGPLSTAPQSVVWSPDCKRVAFVRKHTCLLPDGRRVPCQKFSLQSATITGDVDTLVQVGDEWIHDLLWSVDGTLSFVRGRDEAQYEVSLPGYRIAGPQYADPRPSAALVRRQLPSLGVSETNPRPARIYSVFPDGQRVLCDITMDDGEYRSRHYVIMDLEGRVVTDLAAGRSPVYSEYKDISPDGRYVIGNKSCEAHHSIVSLDLILAPADGAWEAEITRTDSVFEMYPSWSPDGTHIAYSADYIDEDRLVLIVARIEIKGIGNEGD